MTFSATAASTNELSVVLSAARLRAEGKWTPASCGCEDKSVEVSVTATACSDRCQQDQEDLWDAFSEKVYMAGSSCHISEKLARLFPTFGILSGAMQFTSFL